LRKKFLKKIKNKRILVTGGAGFIGSHLCRYLINQGNHVSCLDNLISGQLRNVEDLLHNPLFSFFKQDVTHLLEFDNIDEIYNLACPASPRDYQSNPIETIKTNVLGSINVLELAHKSKATILQASTSEIYGDPEQHPQRESYWGAVNPIGIRSCYDEGKRCAETLFFDYCRKYNLNIRVARIFNTYGPYMRQDDGRVISNFITQALRNQDLFLFGSGKQTRSFCYVSDLVYGLVILMENERNLVGPFNIGNPIELSMSELANKIIGLTNSKSSISFKELPSDDPKKRCPDITLAKNELGWAPKISLEEGLKETINYFKGLDL
jgi:UDP-glucuronate decarboxylase